MKSTHMNKWKQKVKIYIYSYTCVYILCAVFLQQTKSRGNRKKINERNACFVMRYTLRLLIESCNTNEWMHDIVSVRPLLHTFSFLQREERKWNTQSSASDSGNSLKKRRIFYTETCFRRTGPKVTHFMRSNVIIVIVILRFRFVNIDCAKQWPSNSHRKNIEKRSEQLKYKDIATAAP